MKQDTQTLLAFANISGKKGLNIKDRGEWYGDAFFP